MSDEAERLRALLTNVQMPDNATLTVTLGELRAAFSSPETTPAGVSEIDRLADKAKRWHDSGMMSDSEYGAVCAVLFVGDAEAVTDVDREWAREQAAALSAVPAVLTTGYSRCNCPESGTSGSCPFHDASTARPSPERG